MAREVTRSGRPKPPRARAIRAVISSTVPRLLVFGFLVWSIVAGNWYIAAVFAGLAVALGLQAWLITRFMLKRLGGTHARSDV
jgi:uncharacterized membrane protein